VCIAKIIQRALFLGISDGPLAIPWTYACPATKKRVTPRTMDPSMTTPTIAKRGPNYDQNTLWSG